MYEVCTVQYTFTVCCLYQHYVHTSLYNLITSAQSVKIYSASMSTSENSFHLENSWTNRDIYSLLVYNFFLQKGGEARWLDGLRTWWLLYSSPVFESDSCPDDGKLCNLCTWWVTTWYGIVPGGGLWGAAEVQKIHKNQEHTSILKKPFQKEKEQFISNSWINIFHQAKICTVCMTVYPLIFTVCI